MNNRVLTAALGLALAAATASPVLAGIVVYEEGDKKVEVGGRIQLQYMREDPDGGSSSDTLFFRRLRPYIMGTVSEHWMAKIQFDLGKAEDDNEVAVKDAYLEYAKGNIKVTIGNAKHGFSREFLTSSKRQQLVERSFVGDHNFGTPDRIAGVRLSGHNASKKVSYVIGVGQASHDPNAAVMDFDTPVNRHDDWNEGNIVSGRVDFHPLGPVKFDQGDFSSDHWGVTVGVGAFTWGNDDDNNSYTAMGVSTDPGKADLDSADGVEISAGVRGHGFSADAEYQMIDGETVDPMFTGGIYMTGDAELDKMALEAGYMVGGNVEIVAGWDSFDAATYMDDYTRTSVGLNYFVNKHKLKFQATYRMEENVFGVAGADSDVFFGQAQFVF